MTRRKEKTVKKEKRDWYCWHCGKPVPQNGGFVLWSLSDRTDRVFIICFEKKCVNAVRSGEGKKFFLQGMENKVYNF